MVAIAVHHEDAAPVAVPVTTEEAEVSTTFHITTDTAANWLLGKLATIEAEIARVSAQAALIVKQMEADRDSLLYLYQGELSAFVQAKIAQSGGRRKSVHFLQGTCQFRRVPAHLTIGDQAAALQHVKEAALIVKQLEADRDSLLYLYQGELSAFVQQKIAQSGGRRKSVHFLQGTCQFRRVPAHLTIGDQAAALQHVKEAALPGCIQTVEKLDASAYRALAEAWQDTTGGEMLPGIVAVPETDRFSIRFAGSVVDRGRSGLTARKEEAEE